MGIISTELCLMAAAGSQLSSRYLTFLNNRALEKQLLTIQKQTSKTKTQNLWGWRHGPVIRNICSCRGSHSPCGLLMTVCNQSSKALMASSSTCTHIPTPQSVVKETTMLPSIYKEFIKLMFQASKMAQWAKVLAYQARQPEFNPQDSRGGRGELVLLTSMCASFPT